MIRRAAIAVLVAGMLSPAASATPPISCPAPPPVIRLGAPLPTVARAVQRGHDVTIVAIGSSSTQGAGASDSARTYPAVLEAELRRRWPRLRLAVVNKGVGGETADQMVARFERDVVIHRPQLVIWQLGSNSALRGVEIDRYADIVRQGLVRLRAIGADVVLMDPQYAPRVLARPEHRAIVDTIGLVAADHGVAVFQRFAVMRHWVTSGAHRMDDLVSPDRLHMNDASYGCIARLLAAALDAATRAAPLERPEGVEAVKATAGR